jgi:hypothetical protein
VEAKTSRQLGVRLFALDLRLEELGGEMRRTQVRVHQLEAALQDARLSGLFGEAVADAREIEPVLERSRGELDTQQRQLELLKNSRRQARVDYALCRVQERRAQRADPERGEP